jgi:hypothetical protein
LPKTRSSGGTAGDGADPFADPADRPETVEEASRRKEIAHADRAEIMVAKEAGLLVPIEEVAAVVAEENARARTRILAIPNELRPKVLTFLQNDRKAAEQLLTDCRGRDQGSHGRDSVLGAGPRAGSRTGWRGPR